MLQMFFGDDVHFGVTSSRFGGETRFFDSFSEPLAEIIEARIWAGLHFRTADVQAVILGQNVVDYMPEHYFQAVGNHCPRTNSSARLVAEDQSAPGDA